MGSRWYDGGWAAFLSRDTVFGELRTPVSLNRFTYAFANPISFFDPDGRCPIGMQSDPAQCNAYDSKYGTDRDQVLEDTVTGGGSTPDGCNAAGFCESDDADDGATPDTAPEEADAALEELEGRGGVFVPPEMIPHQQFIGFVVEQLRLRSGGGATIDFDRFGLSGPSQQGMELASYIASIDLIEMTRDSMLLEEDSFGSFADWDSLTQGMSDAEIAFWVELGHEAAQERFFGQQAALAGAGMDIGIAINAGIGKSYNGMSGVFDDVTGNIGTSGLRRGADAVEDACKICQRERREVSELLTLSTISMICMASLLLAESRCPTPPTQVAL